MSGFDLYGDKSVENLAALPRTQVADPGFGEGFFRGTGMAIMREAFAKPARSMSMLGAVAPIAVDAITGGTTLQDKYFRTHQDVFDNAVKFWTPQPGEVGIAAELAGGLIGTLGQIVLSPHLAVSNQILSQGEDLVTQPGVSAGQALAVGIAQGAGLGVGIWAPPALGYNLVTKAATGAGVNLLQGIMTRGASAAILGDNPAARNFPAFGGEEMLFDVLLGAAFGTAAHYVPRWKAETENATTRLDIAARGPGKSPAEAALRPGARAVQEAINVWAQNVTPTEQAALATMRVAKHLNADSMPGRPTGPASVEVHVAAMREAIQSLLTDQPVTARVTNDDGSPIQREPTQPATRDMLAQARQELEQGQPGAGYQELLDIMAEPPGPRRAELLGNLRPDLAQAKEAPADPEQASLWAEIHQPDPAAKPTPIADLEAAVRAWNPESQVFHVKQPPLFTPEQTAGAEARLTALEAEAARIAAQEGLPPPPRQDIDAFVSREVAAAGRPQEEAAAAGVAWKSAFESFGRAARVDPTELFYRYMDRVIGYGAAQPDAATTLMQAGTRPANNIEAYAPQVIPSQRNKIPQFRARDIAMIKPDMMLSSATKGKRASWLIYSVDANNKATKVGYVIADYNPADNTFHALRRIEIDDSLRGTGIGERTIAMMLRQNNGKPMEVHDIVHAGVQGTKDDALPFWKKLGIRLDNYSSNPDIQMDGRMTLADYLGARGGQGLREGRAGDAAQAVPPDGAGSRGGGAGAGGGDAGRLFQSPTGRWYYSALSAAIDAAPPRAQNAGTWKQWLQAQINAGRIKETEVEWSGIREFLDTQEGKISPDQLRAYMEQGGVRVEEVELGKARAPLDTDGTPRGWAIVEGGGTRFDTYQLPGAKPGSYRELALTLPARPGEPTFEVPGAHSMGPDADTNRIAHIRFNERTTSDGKRVLFIEEIQSDWAQQGKKSGFAGEAGATQADLDALTETIKKEYAAKLVEKGIFTQEEAMGAAEDTSRDTMARVVGRGDEFTRMVNEVHANKSKVPVGPFVGTTDAWVGLVMKRMIRYAAENGFDQIAWTRGDQQVERYASALRKQVDRIEWKKTPEGVHLVGYKGTEDARRAVEQMREQLLQINRRMDDLLGDRDIGDLPPQERARANALQVEYQNLSMRIMGQEQQTGRQVVDTTQKETALSDAIGKAMAKQILEDPNQSGTIEGDAITIDDTGMAAFYDRIVPNVAKEVLRKLGGGQIRETELTVDGEPEWQQAFDITPEVRAKAMQAQALFQRAGHMSPHTFDQFDHSHIGRGEGAQVYGWGTYLWTNRAVGDWYYNNFERAAQRDASITIREGPLDTKWMGPNSEPTAEAKKLFTEEQLVAMSAFDEELKKDDHIVKAYQRAESRIRQALDHDGRRSVKSAKAIAWLSDLITIDMAARKIGVNDDPAYKTPDGRMVHASMQGAAKSLADAIAQVESYGYERAAQTFDNLIRQAAEHARNQIEDLQRYVDATQRDIDTPMTARKVADTQYAVSFEHQSGKPRRAAIGITAADEVEAVLKAKQYLEKEHNDAKARLMEQTRRLNERVDELQRTRQLVDDITQPDTYKLKKDGDRWYVVDQRGEQASTSKLSKREAEHDLAYLNSTGSRSLKPGYEKVQPQIKKPRHYTVEAPENDILIDWSKKVSEQPKPVLEALERGGIKVITEKEVTATARDLWEMDRSILEQRVNESTSDAEREDARADMLAQAGEDSRAYKDRATEFLLDDYSSREDYSFGVLENESGRVLYTSMMEQFGYRSGPLDGPNTQYAAQASEAFAKMGIPGHRYLDGSSRRRGDGTYNLVIYDDKAMQIVHMEQTRERGFLQIGDQRKMLIGLGKDADASTFMHESAHFFLEVMDDLSTTVPALKADMEVLFKEWGIDRAAWDQMDLNAKRPYHEMFAESFEVYLMTNKAPTPELRTVFQRFRDWLLDIYQVATATGRKVSQPMRDLFDRMLDAQRRETTTTQAAQPTEGTPPPPRPEGGEPPGVVDPFDFETTGEPQPPAPLTLDDQGMREMIREAVEKESGWYQIGGRHMGGEHGVPNFSEWIPNGPWWVARPDKKLNAQGYINAVAKALVGDKLKPIEQRAVQYLLDHLNQRRVDEWKAARQEWDQLSAEVAAEGLQPTPENVIDANTVARAAAIDEAMVERLAMQYDGDDVGFMAEIRRMIDAQQNPATVQGGEGSPAAAPETAQAAAVADGRGDGQPAAGRQPDAAREAADDPLAREADRVAVENPAMVLQFDQPDGTVVRMTAAQYLEQVRMEAELARQDVSLLEVAAECMLGARS